MKSWGAIFITAVGFLIGVVLAGIGGVSAKTGLFSHAANDPQKRIEKYWTETDISEKELFDLVSNSNCQSSEKYFLACVNSVTQNLSDKHQYLSPETGEVESASAANLDDDEMSEKQRLSAYVQIYTRRLSSKIDFEKIWKQMLASEKPDSQAQLIGAGINSFLSIHKDPHTYILPESYYGEVSSQLERTNTFVGLSFEKIRSQIFIRKVFKNSDADVAGLQVNDEIIHINNQNVNQLNLNEISQIIKDTQIKDFHFKIVRNNETKEIHVLRRYKSLSHVQFEILKGIKNFAIVTLTKFNRGVCEEVAHQIRSASEKNISGLILDLRDNPGGQLDEAACLAGLFLGMNKKTYSVEFFDPLKSNEVVLSTGSLLYTGPLVVITNSSSASASELLAGALQDYRRALIVGEKTFGKGTFQESEEWTKNKKIILFKTQGFYLLPSHVSPQIFGIIPDIKLDEKHLKWREENMYFNPIQNISSEVRKVNHSEVTYQDSLNKCLDYSDVMLNRDPLLQKSLQILSCHRITSLLAQQYNPMDFN